ncbi:MbcA/ParS/Xre antitoxin family protein [Rhodococcus sp. NPDC058521]|uniref:MbcA/ParS/Xre antitoxin family protein n=1 Tax=Rhodococcus sp. NPDC058521 TaxID=3346536 RepID=UPI00365D401F
MAAPEPIALRVRRLARLFGTAGISYLLGVADSEVMRWASGHDAPDAKAITMLTDLEDVFVRACLVWGREGARSWMESPNVFFSGAAPFAVLRREGAARVLEVLDAEAWGGGA